MNRLPDIDFDTMKCSALLVEPKETFLTWVAHYAENKVPPQSLEDVYCSEEDGVWIIPTLGAFETDVAFQEFIDTVKPKLLAMEIGRFVYDMTHPPVSLDVATFDSFFELHYRAVVSDIRELLKHSRNGH